MMLCRDRGVLKRSVVTHGYYVRETVPTVTGGDHSFRRVRTNII